MSAELFKSMAGIDLLHVPYKGSGQALPDLITGRVSMMFENMPGAVSYIQSGKPQRSGGHRAGSAHPHYPT